MHTWLFLSGFVCFGIALVALVSGLVLELKRLGLPNCEQDPSLSRGIKVCHLLGMGLLPLAGALLVTLFARM